MSDNYDSMEVDETSDVNISDLNLETSDIRGKGRATNSSIGAEDNLPWVEKYRPDTLADMSGHQDILTTISKFVETNARSRLPHLLFYGPPGTGKTSTILALARQIYGSKNLRQMVLELNASDDRGIEVVREQIKTFASTKQIFSMVPSNTGASSIAPFKLIILDEADAMTSTAQMALRRIMEKYTSNTRFCIIANYTHKLSPALLSRCTRFRFSPLKERDIQFLIEKVIKEEDVQIIPEAIQALVKLSKGDMRRALNVLQACHASSKPLLPKGTPQTADASYTRETITETVIYECIASPHPSDIAKILNTLLNTPDVLSCLKTINQLKSMHGLALADIITGLSEELSKLDVPAPVLITWLDGLAETEYRLSGGGTEAIQTGAVVGVVRNGAELITSNRN
ncbi:Replication factor C subunit 3 [Golovinomyces cichoracearum]|uniref:Replication factor C subunit 3 n=1 Tax=Golovinomyces cichoracearum TaxID=62708 RepID=A0A420J0Y9_9PEZI|nr:Replication factor C subunit 3 [Golovinomyces cichoracearum]